MENEIDDLRIKLPEWSEEMKELFKETSEYVKALPLNNKENDELVNKMAQCTIKARQEGFAIGVGMVLESMDREPRGKLS